MDKIIVPQNFGHPHLVETNDYIKGPKSTEDIFCISALSEFPEDSEKLVVPRSVFARMAFQCMHEFVDEQNKCRHCCIL